METILAGSFGLLIGIVGLWTAFRQLKNREALDRWPTTKGRVIERGVFQPNTPVPGLTREFLRPVDIAAAAGKMQTY